MPECVGPMDPPFWTLFRHEEIFSIVLLCVHLNLKTLNMRTSYMGMLRLFGASQRFKLGPMIDNVDKSISLLELTLFLIKNVFWYH